MRPGISLWPAGVAQLVEHHGPHVNVDGSNPFARSSSDPVSHDAGSFHLMRTEFRRGVSCRLGD
jgi:hypothetical protein